MTDADREALVERGAETLWQDESLRTAWRPRSVSWQEVDDQAKNQWRRLFRAALSVAEPVVRADEREACAVIASSVRCQYLINNAEDEMRDRIVATIRTRSATAGEATP